MEHFSMMEYRSGSSTRRRRRNRREWSGGTGVLLIAPMGATAAKTRVVVLLQCGLHTRNGNRQQPRWQRIVPYIVDHAKPFRLAIYGWNI